MNPKGMVHIPSAGWYYKQSFKDLFLKKEEEAENCSSVGWINVAQNQND